MIKKFMIIFVLLFCGLLCSIELYAEPPEPSGDRLRTIVENNYPDKSVIIGGTISASNLGSNTSLIMDREFSYVTPENDFKHKYINSNPTQFDWTWPDKWVQHIVDNNQVLRMHCPIGPQVSEWSQNDARTAAELETNMRAFLKAICERYNGKPGFEYMDVVNETIKWGTWHKDRPGVGWECPWYKIGLDNDKNETPLYIKIAFEIVKQYAPDIKFIFNHHEDFTFPQSWELIKETISYLRAKGLRVDGIGWQAHVDNGWATTDNLNKLKNLIDWAHSNSLEFHITEASVWLKNGNSQELLEEQAATYRAIVNVLLEKRTTGKVGWNIWHIDDSDDSDTWNKKWYPSLFDADYVAKPAYYAIQEELEISAPSIPAPGSPSNLHIVQ